ncbi:MAG: hypothetical protein AB1941_27425 [Gemmatimonadota bacterium]
MPSSIVCQNCGEKIDPSQASCPLCGAQRPHAAAPEVWRPPASRRAALVAGILLALLIVAALVWRIADSRKTPLEGGGQILPMDESSSR